MTHFLRHIISEHMVRVSVSLIAVLFRVLLPLICLETVIITTHWRGSCITRICALFKTSSKANC